MRNMLVCTAAMRTAPVPYPPFQAPLVIGCCLEPKFLTVPLYILGSIAIVLLLCPVLMKARTAPCMMDVELF